MNMCDKAPDELKHFSHIGEVFPGGAVSITSFC